MSQLMNQEELHLTGLNLLLQWLEANGNEIAMAQPEQSVLPHIIIKSGELLTFIAVAISMYPDKGKFSEAEQAALYQHAEKFGAFAALASIGLANAAGVVPHNQKILARATKDAQFLMDFAGLQYLGRRDFPGNTENSSTEAEN